jgi:hypothetical protein
MEFGIRDCNESKTNEPRILVASAAAGKPPLAAQPGAEKPILAGLMDKLLSVFGAGKAAGAMHNRVAVSSQPAAKLAEIPLPPARPVELTQTAGAIAAPVPGQLVGEAAGQNRQPNRRSPRPRTPFRCRRAGRQMPRYSPCKG